MKNFKRIASAVAALALAATLAVPMSATLTASAAAGDITFAGDTVGDHTYTAYKIFSGTASGSHFNTSATKTDLTGIEWAPTKTTGTDAAHQTGTAFYDAVNALVTKANNATDRAKLADWELEIVNMFAPLTDTAEDWDADDNQHVIDADIKTASHVAQILAKAQDDDAKARAFARFIVKNSTALSLGSGVELEEASSLVDSGDGYYVIVETDFTKDDSTTAGEKVGAMSFYLLGVYDADGEAVTVTVKSDSPTVEKKIKEDDKTDGDWNTSNAYGDDYNDTADYSIGDKVPFKLYGTLPSDTAMGYYETYIYEFHDTLGNEFTLLKSDGTEITLPETPDGIGEGEGHERTTISGFDASCVTVKIGTTDVTSTSGYYTVDAYVTPDGKIHIDVKFADIKKAIAELDVSASEHVYPKVTVEYDTRLNSNAVIGRDGQTNEVYLSYSSNPGNSGTGTHETTDTPKDKVVAFTYEVDLTKVDNNVQTDALGGAVFYLKEGNAYAVIDSNNKIVDWVTPSGDVTYGENGEINNADQLTWTSKFTGETTAQRPSVIKSSETATTLGQFKFIGLDDGTYTLLETKAPEGYVIPSGGQIFTLIIEADTSNGHTGTGSGEELEYVKLYIGSKAEENLKDSDYDEGDDENFDTTDDGKLVAKITNSSVSQLPSTGGIGTTLFYVIGGTLVVGAGVTLITKKRMQKD